MSNWAVSGPRTGVLDEGCSYFIGMKGELSTNLPGPFSLWGPAFASLAENENSAAVSNGASLAALPASGGPMSQTASSIDARGSLGASWATPSKAGKASEARSEESTTITVGLF